MATKQFVTRGGVRVLGTLGDGSGDEMLTRDSSTKDVGVVPSVDAVNFISSTLQDGRILIGNSSNIAQARLMSGMVTMTNTGVASVTAGSITNTHISGAAGITYSKLNLTGQIRNADILTTAAIARTKLANGTANRIIINNGSGVMEDAAAISGNRLLVSNVNGIPVHSSVTSTEAGYLSGVTSAIQTQFSNKLSFSSAITPVTGDIVYYTGGAWNRLAMGTSGQVLTSTGATIAWGAPTANGLPTGGTANQYLRKVDGTNYNATWDTLTVAKITDITASAAELNITDGLTATTTELNYSDGVLAPIQGQLDLKLERALAYNAIFVGDASNSAVELAPGSNGQVLQIVGVVPQWQTLSPPGDVSGPVSSTDNAIVRWNGTSGDSIQDSSILISDTWDISGVTTLSSGQISVLNQDALRLYETGSTNYVGLRASGTMAADYTITLPAAAPASNTYLKYDGANYVWDVAGGGAGTITGSIATGQVAFATNTDEIGGEAAFLYDSTLNLLTVENILLTPQAGLPGSPVEGQISYVNDPGYVDIIGYVDGTMIQLTRPFLVTIDNTDSPYTPVEDFRNGITYVDTTAGDVTIDLNSGLSRHYFHTFVNVGTGNMIFDPAGGFTLNATDDTCSTQFGAVSITYVGSNTFYAFGALGSGGGGGGVSSVALAAPSFLSVSGSPVTSSGTLTLSLATQTANTIFAGPTAGAAAAPTFRALIATDIPDLSSLYLTGNETITLSGDVSGSGATAITTTLATVNGNVGTFGSATQAPQFTVNAKGLITAASNVTVTPAVGSITGLGTGVATALAVNTGTAGSFVVNGGVLGTPSSGTLTNATGLPVSTGISGLGTGIATWLGTPSWTNFSAAITGTAPFWGLTGTSTFTGNVTIARGTSTMTYTNTATSTSVDELTISGGGMTASSGSNHLFRGVVATPTYNMTGTVTASNIRWLDYNPTATSITGTTHYAATFRLGTVVIGSSAMISTNQYSLDIDAAAYSGNAIRVSQAATGGAVGIMFGRSSTDIATITATGSSAGIPNALYMRTALAGGNMVFATAINSVAMMISSTQKVSIGPSSLTATASLHIQAGTAAAGSAPIKLNTGTALTTPEDGAIEYHGSHLYFTIGSTRYQLDQQGGITNTAVANEMAKSDGTNLVPSGVFSTSAGNLILGSASISGGKSISTASSDTDAWLGLAGKGASGVRTHGVFLVGNTLEYTDPNYENRSIYMSALGSDYRITGGNGDSGVAKDFTIKAADGFNTDADGRGLNLISGAGDGAGVDGNITIDTLTGYLIIATIPTSSAGLPSGAVWSNSNVLTIVP